MLDQTILQKMRELPLERQQQVLDFIEFMTRKEAAQTQRKRRNIIGLLSDFGTDITVEEIRELRREMWGNFPRDVEL
jgi:hypothetical protein